MVMFSALIIMITVVGVLSCVRRWKEHRTQLTEKKRQNQRKTSMDLSLYLPEPLGISSFSKRNESDIYSCGTPTNETPVPNRTRKVTFAEEDSVLFITPRAPCGRMLQLHSAYKGDINDVIPEDGYVIIDARGPEICTLVGSQINACDLNGGNIINVYDQDDDSDYKIPIQDTSDEMSETSSAVNDDTNAFMLDEMTSSDEDLKDAKCKEY